jgi:uncharacterized protein YbbK (DUF523 family)
MNRQQREMKIEMLRREIAFLEMRSPCCGNCQSYMGRSLCEKAPSHPIPAEILSTGCESWADDGVPF